MGIIYGLIDPVNGELRYIGKGRDLNRPKAHFRKKQLDREGNSHKINWIKYLQKQGLNPEVKIIQELPNNCLFEAEIYWIKYFREAGCRLTNLTNGGEGMFGWVPGEETREKWRKALKNKPRPQHVKDAIGNAHRGKIMSEESRKKMSIAKKGISPWNKGKNIPYNGIVKKVIDQNGNLYNTVQDASLKLKIPICSIRAVCRGTRNSVFGYIFKYVN